MNDCEEGDKNVGLVHAAVVCTYRVDLIYKLAARGRAISPRKQQSGGTYYNDDGRSFFQSWPRESASLTSHPEWDAVTYLPTHRPVSGFVWESSVYICRAKYLTRDKKGNGYYTYLLQISSPPSPYITYYLYIEKYLKIKSSPHMFICCIETPLNATTHPLVCPELYT